MDIVVFQRNLSGLHSELLFNSHTLKVTIFFFHIIYELYEGDMKKWYLDIITQYTPIIELAHLFKKEMFLG